MSLQKIPGFEYYQAFKTTTINKIIWPYSLEDDGLIRWRATILFAILTSGFVLGTIAFAGAVSAIVKEGAWTMAVVNSGALALCAILLWAPKLIFEIRAATTCLLFFLIGASVILMIGPRLGGPAWLFSFSVLSGVLLGNTAAFAAIFINALFLVAISLFMLNGTLDFVMPFLSSPKDMVASVANFLVANTITAISVTTLVKGVFGLYKEKKRLTRNLGKEQADLLAVKEKLEEEIKERRLAEQDLKIKNLVFEAGITANSISDANGFLTNVNYAFLRLWGYQKEEDVLGKPISRFLKYEDETIKIISSLDQAQTWEGEYTALRKDGSTFTAYGLATTINGAEGIIGYQSSVIDISDRKKAEIERIEAHKIAGEQEKYALVGQIAGKMAHDFNNVLGIIMGNAELGQIVRDEERINNIFKLIFQQTIRGKNLTQNLVAFAKDQEPKQEFFRFKEKLDLVLDLLEKDLEGIDIIRKDASGLPDLLADPGMIEHSLVNLIQNAIHAVSLNPKPEIFLRTHCVENSIHLELRDNGCGIPEEHLESIYEPAFTLKGSKDTNGVYNPAIKGTGYGLSNVKKYVAQHNGTLAITSKIDKGTTVFLSLPITGKKLTDREIRSFSSLNPVKEKAILLVEDESSIADVYYRILTGPPFYHHVDIAPNAQTAIDLYSNNSYDLISLDYILPGSKNGMDVYEFVRKNDTGTPILFISGNIEFLESIKKLLRKDSFLKHLSKPCPNDVYLTQINRLLEIKTAK